MEPPPVPGASPAAVAALPTLVPAPLVAGQEEDELEVILELPPLDELGATSSSRRSAGSFENSGRTTTKAGQSLGFRPSSPPHT
ncbi:hypothetical protein PVAP13_3NG079532 [Panicum virgatum]|uniref:Uncharacterized protein n=1 Tax=Panicum virgatum TaxID=38727 RepID=A0A8T0UD44_PANVG|nr:hypothetical protein PVAP13_3NG079532 [Panicum virgatum]